MKKATIAAAATSTTFPIIPILLGFLLGLPRANATEPPQQFVTEPQVLVVERGPHHRILQISTTTAPDPSVSSPTAEAPVAAGVMPAWKRPAVEGGILPPVPPPRARANTNYITELQAGLHRWTDDRGWVETHPRFESFPDAVLLRNLQYSAIFAPNLATPNAFEIQLPPATAGGDVAPPLGGHLLGLAYTDPDGTSVLIAEVKDSAAVIGGGPDQNELTYPDAFTDFNITVKYIAHRDRLSQLLLIHQQLPPPTEWGLSDDAVLEVLTELTHFPDLTREPREPVNGVSGEHLRFDTMEFVTGKAFSVVASRPVGTVSQLSPGAEAPSTDNSAIVQKQMQLFEGNRWFLVEKVPWKIISPELAKLPPVANTWRKKHHRLLAGRAAAMEGRVIQVPELPTPSGRAATPRGPNSIMEGRVIRVPEFSDPSAPPAPMEGRVTRLPGRSLAEGRTAKAGVPEPIAPVGAYGPDPSGSSSGFQAFRLSSRQVPEPPQSTMSTTSILPPVVPSRPAPHAKRIASPEAASHGNAAAYVIDWELVTTINSNLWKADTTWYISGPVTVKTNVFEGGTVIKYAPTNNARLTITGPINYGARPEGPGVMPSHGNPYRPIILTARDDHSIGAPIGTNLVLGMYATKALELDYYSSGVVYDLHDFRISHASLGLSFFQGHGHVARNLQLVNCREAIQAYNTTFHLLNALLHNVTLAFTASGAANTTGNVQHVTFNQCSNLNSATLQLFATNSLFVAVTNLTPFTGAYNGTNPSPAAVLQAIGAGANYLAAGSPFRNAGTTNIEVALRNALQALTTYPPIVVGHITTLSNTNLILSPQAGRDTDTPDFGWHYSPLDYALGGVLLTNATITVTPGTAIALYSPTNTLGSYYGLALSDNAKLVSEGTALNRNRIVRYNTVQEQSQTTWNTTPVDHVLSDWTDPPIDPEARFRFTDWSIAAADTSHFGGYEGADVIVPFQNCQFWGGKLQTVRPTFNATNCLFYRTAMILEGIDHELDATFQNNLLHGGSVYFSQEFGGSFTFTDNVFDRVAIAQFATPTHNYNGYITNGAAQWLTNSGTHNVFTNTFTWVTGTLGRFYQPTNSPFLNLGSTNANLLGLYHYTVLTNNVKETNSTVDMGFHYVATDAGGNPLDGDSDGTPDYFEEINGNGAVDSGETNWQSGGDGGLRVLITRPRNGTILP